LTKCCDKLFELNAIFQLNEYISCTTNKA